MEDMATRLHQQTLPINQLLLLLKVESVYLYAFDAKQQPLFTAMISHIDGNAERFELTMQTDLTDLADLPEKQTYLVKCFYNHIMLEFNMNLQIMSEPESNYPIFIAEFPEKYMAEQRRRAFRVSIRDGQMILQDNFGKTLTGDVQDVSVLGVRAWFEGNLQNYFNLDDVIEQSSVKLMEQLEIDCQLQIKRNFFQEKSQKTEIAGEFIDLAFRQEAALGEFVNHQQAQYLSRYANL